MKIVINKCFLLNPEKKFGADPSCRFQENAKITQLQRTPIPKKWCHLAEGYFNSQLKC